MSLRAAGSMRTWVRNKYLGYTDKSRNNFRETIPHSKREAKQLNNRNFDFCKVTTKTIIKELS